MQAAKAILHQTSGSTEKVCRNLFGSVDHEQLKLDAGKIMKMSLKEAKQRWNFDFANETPIEGPYKWERVIGDNDILHVNIMDVGSNQKENQSQDGASTYMEKGNKTCVEECHGMECTDSGCGKRKQKLITDFYHVKRRSSPVSSP
ncbi:hypothetical protein GDO86_003199 [Hymenochirus boettgeri]|uniref:Cyclin-dependent kinase inhibitor domain-containing protein n=1 Tax=Hymenochirus boettgeri TaxID=247094 RepID=A0A8T2K8J6_9PIPI|nr:hypothetical protein GDO86_003199 [Hymenochirus boettgeri]KAG8450837.1 hypothetical protein GDO86_003199 [Hymenochirus boettgeri]